MPTLLPNGGTTFNVSGQKGSKSAIQVTAVPTSGSISIELDNGSAALIPKSVKVRVGAAEKKAYTALSTKTATMLLSQNANENKDAKNLTTLSNLLLLGGGLPVRYENQVVGAIGVAGAGGAKNDHYCAETAVKSIFNP